jgi:hypothetical protein
VDFRKNCGELAAYFIKIGTMADFGNSSDPRRLDRADARSKHMRTGVPSTIRSPCNTSFTMQPAVHHSGRMQGVERGKGVLRRAKIRPLRMP